MMSKEQSKVVVTFPLGDKYEEEALRIHGVIEKLKGLHNDQIQAFLVALVRKANEHSDVRNYPFPNAVAREIICSLFEQGKP
jgi:hypothetical protein